MQIAARLDRLPVTGKHRYFVAVVGVATFFDLYDLFLAATISTVLSKEFGVGAGALKWFIASAFIGSFFGALLLGRLADRVGRRRAFLITLGLYSAATLVGAFSPGVWMLVVCRFVAGVGIGAELPLADAYLADLLPARSRGRVTAWAYTFGFCGVPAAGFLARALAGHAPLGVEGWRWLFVLGALGSAVVWVLRFGLPESPRWLASRGREVEADAIVTQLEAAAKTPLPEPVEIEETKTEGSLLKPPWLKRTAMLYVFQLLQTFGYYGFGSLVPIVLAAKGIGLVSSLTFAAITFIGYPVGSALSIPVIERVERKWLIVSSAAGMAVFGLAFGYATSGVLIAAFGFCYTAISNVFSNAFHTYQGELFPTNLRATAAGSAYALSRLATAFMPFILLPVLTGGGPTAMFAVVAGAMVVLMIDIAVLGPRTTGKSVEAI